MPLVRIDLLRGRSAEDRKAIGEATYQALLSVGVPADDRFQIIAEHTRDNFIFDAGYLGIERTDALIMIQITWNEGRSLEQKRALYRAIVEGLKALSVRPEDVLVNLVEVKKENWSFGNGEAQYAP